MSNTTVQVPAHIAARIAARQKTGATSAIAAAINTAGGLNIPRISIRAGRYRLCEDGVETPVGVTLDVVIIGANPRVSKIFYSKPYDGSADGVAPDCLSNDGVSPDAAIQDPVCSSCAACPNNVLGSKILPSGAKSKLCADQRHLAVVAAADPHKVYSLTIPVSGMRALREYFKDLTNYGIGPEEVITELGFDDAASYPKIVFSRKGYVPEKSLDKIDALVESDDVKIATHLMPPRERPSLAAPQQAALVDDAYEDEEEQSKVVSGAAKKTKPKTAPVKVSDELSAKLDDLFE